MCGTDAKAKREVAWRQRTKRANIVASFISTDELHWQTLQWSDNVTINVLTDKGSGPVCFFKATELIQKLGLSQRLKDKVIGGAPDKWLALEWIPRRMIRHIQTFSGSYQGVFGVSPTLLSSSVKCLNHSISVR
jgi:hypothetical protein